VGFSQLNIQRQGERYGKVLAQSTPRKLALVVGINQYQSQPLDGCINDVELQRHLLISLMSALQTENVTAVLDI
jgi:hypothetical protein